MIPQVDIILLAGKSHSVNFIPFLLMHAKMENNHIFFYRQPTSNGGNLANPLNKILYSIEPPMATRCKTLTHCWPSICDAGPTSSQHWVNP